MSAKKMSVASIGANANSKYPLTFLMKIKRGVAWSNRRVELDKDAVKYYKTDDNELRFNEKLDDCKLREKHPEDAKKYYLVLESKNGSFKDVNVSADSPSLIKQFKKDFDYIQSYKSAISSIQNKTFFIESDKKKIERANTVTGTGTAKFDTETVLRSVIGEDNATVNQSVTSFNETDLISNLGKESNEYVPVEEELVVNTEMPTGTASPKQSIEPCIEPIITPPVLDE